MAPLLVVHIVLGTAFAAPAPGRSDVGVFPMPGASTSLPIAGVPPGIYYLRMRAVNAVGAGVASREIEVIVP